MDGRGRREVVLLDEGEELGRKTELVEVETGRGRLHLLVGEEVVDLDLIFLLPGFDGVCVGRRVVGVEVLRERLIAALAVDGCDQVDLHFLVQKGVSILVVGNYMERKRENDSWTRFPRLDSFLHPLAEHSQPPPSPSPPADVNWKRTPALEDY